MIGFAAAIKLTPALFVLFAFLIGKARVAITAMISFAVFTGIGAILLFRETLVFFGGLSGGDTRTASPLYAGNQSLLGVFFRLGDSSRTTTLLGLAVSGVLAVLGCLVAAHWWRNDEKVFAVALVGPHDLPGIAAVVDPSLCLDPAHGDGRAVTWRTSLGSLHRRLLGGLGLLVSAARSAPVRRRSRAAVRRRAAGGGQPGPDLGRDLGRRSGLAARRHDPHPNGPRCRPLTPVARARWG